MWGCNQQAANGMVGSGFPSTLPIPMASYAGVSRVRWNRPLHGALAITCCRSLPIRRNKPNQGTLALTLPRGSRRQGGKKKKQKKKKRKTKKKKEKKTGNGQKKKTDH